MPRGHVVSESYATAAPVDDSSRRRDAARPLLEVEDLRTWFRASGDAVTRAVDGVSFAIERGRTMGLVGESGCGKSVTALSIMGLVPAPGRVESGRIGFDGRDLPALDESEMQKIRGNRISMIFQEPMTSLNPVHTVGAQVAEVYRLHRGLGRRAAWREAVAALERVRIPSAVSRAKDYPHQMSGGMRQRVMIAMALACDPDLLIADEPTTALDVTVQAQILRLMEELQEKSGASVLLITHDLGVVSEVADEIAVMYAGNIVESGPAATILSSTAHPYTLGLIRSRPRIESAREGERLQAIPGNVPKPTAWPEGCRFHPRCPHVRESCKQRPPDLGLFGPGHATRCIRAREIFG
ncbi:ABC transporter ATP-binding protein [Candidatus Sumerlaeota bacterium]|nr:ABC transporter ATP-binding protein [Candidatus Sumerlaeota bacterium]